jgi:hypothetical protein
VQAQSSTGGERHREDDECDEVKPARPRVAHTAS